MKVLFRLEKWSSLYVLYPKLPLKLSRMFVFDLTEVRSVWFPIKLFSLKRLLSSVLVKMQYQCQIPVLFLGCAEGCAPFFIACCSQGKQCAISQPTEWDLQEFHLLVVDVSLTFLCKLTASLLNLWSWKPLRFVTSPSKHFAWVESNLTLSRMSDVLSASNN